MKPLYIRPPELSSGNKTGNICDFFTDDLSMALDKKHLRQRGNVWWLHYRIPDRYKLLPECMKYKDILTMSLETDSLREARRRRDVFLHGLEAQADDHYKAWLPKRLESIAEETAPQVTSKNPLLISPKLENPNMENVRAIISRGSATLGKVPKLSKMASVAEREREAVFALLGAKRHSGKSIKDLTKLVVRDKLAQDRASKTINKIERSTTWFLEQVMQRDIDIDQIDYDMVNDFVMAALDQGVSGSTINGYLSGLGQIWMRAKRSKIVSGDNPFREHSYKKESISYDPFTVEEMHELYAKADPTFKTLIHAGATTGARISELLEAEVRVFSGYLCWAFNFKRKGKTKQSTRIVPFHDSLKLEEGFTFDLTYTPARIKMQELVNNVLGKRFNELTGKERRLTFHSFRSTVITELVARQHLNDKTVGSVTGHKGGGASNAGSINTYISVEELKIKKDIIDRIPWSFS